MGSLGYRSQHTGSQADRDASNIWLELLYVLDTLKISILLVSKSNFFQFPLFYFEHILEFANSVCKSPDSFKRQIYSNYMYFKDLLYLKFVHMYVSLRP